MPSIGAQAKMGFGSTSTVDKPMEFLRENIKKRRQVMDTNGIRGTRSVPAERTRSGPTTVSGSISMNPSPVELDTILRYITGTAKNGSSQFPLAETIESFYIAIDRVAKVPVYDGCKIASARFACAEGQLLDLTLNIEGVDETVGAAASFPSLTLDTGDPYCFYDAVMTIGGTPYSIRDWELNIDNGLRPRHLNSATRTAINETDRVVSMRATLPYTSTEVGLYNTLTTGAAVVFTLTNGAVSLTLSMADVQFDTESPEVGSKDEIFLTLAGRARKSGSTLELVITNDSTP